MEKILEIKETSFEGKDGFIIKTDKQEIKLGIDNDQSCCENWGYFMSNDNLDEFIGAKLIDISVTDVALNTEKLVDTYDGGTMFVNLNTDNGTLQFVAYNSHNGYYGHEASVVSKQLIHSENL